MLEEYNRITDEMHVISAEAYADKDFKGMPKEWYALLVAQNNLPPEEFGFVDDDIFIDTNCRELTMYRISYGKIEIHSGKDYWHPLPGNSDICAYILYSRVFKGRMIRVREVSRNILPRWDDAYKGIVRDQA